MNSNEQNLWDKNSDKEVALSRLTDLNTQKIAGVELWRYFIKDDVSFWSFFQTQLFNEFKGDITNKRAESNISVLEKIKVGLYFLFMATVSAAEVIRSFFYRSSVLIFGIDIYSQNTGFDPRIEKLYEYCQKNNLNFISLLHSRIDNRIAKNFLNRKRPSIYLELFKHLYLILKPFLRKNFKININKELKDKNLIDKYIEKAECSAFLVNCLSLLFKFLKPKQIWCIDDSRNVHEIIIAARRNQISIYLFQHGRFHRYLPGFRYLNIPAEFCLLPNRFFAWSEFWKKELVSTSQLYSKNQNIISACGRSSNFGITKKIELDSLVSKDGKIIILIPHEVDAEHSQVKKYIYKLLKDKRIIVWYKIRADQSVKIQIEHALLDEFINKDNFIVKTSLSDDDLRKVNFVAGTYSTYLYEMLEIGLSVCIFRTSKTEAYDLVENNFAFLLADDVDDIYSAFYESQRDKKIKNNFDMVVKNDITETLRSLI